MKFHAVILYVVCSWGISACAQEGESLGVIFCEQTNGNFTVCEFTTNGTRHLRQWRDVVVSRANVEKVKTNNMVRVRAPYRDAQSVVGEPREFQNFIAPPPSFHHIGRQHSPQIQQTEPPLVVCVDRGVKRVGFQAAGIFFLIENLVVGKTHEVLGTNWCSQTIPIELSSSRREQVKARIETEER